MNNETNKVFKKSKQKTRRFMLRRIWNLINTKLQQLPWFDIRMCSLFDALWFYYVNDNIYKANECFYRSNQKDYFQNQNNSKNNQFDY